MDKFEFKNIKRQFAAKPVPQEKVTDGKYVKYGVYNDFPQHLIDLFNNSSIHGTCVNAIVDGIVGEGLIAEPSFVLDQANPKESWNAIYKKMALDFKLYGGYALEVVWNKSRTKVAAVYHIDFSYLRAAEKNYRGEVPGYYISDEWNDKRNYINVAPEDYPYLPVFDYTKAMEEPKQIYVYRPYSPGQKYYPLPDYIGALDVIELDHEVDRFHINNIQNGLAPSLAITTYTNADPDQREQIEEMLRMQYAGAENAGNLLYMDLDDPANKPDITPIPSNQTDTYYTTINDLVVQKILTAHRITSPMILGIKTEGQLGGRTEVLDAYLLLLNTVIRPYQQILLSSIEELLGFQYPELEDELSVGVQQLKLYEQGEEEVDVVTSVDTEIGEDSQLEEKIEEADEAASDDNNDTFPI
jgi:hypothetical protein